MKDNRLPKDELEKIKQQYYSLSESLTMFRKNMRGREYRRIFSKEQQMQIRQQYQFYKKALNATLRCLVGNEDLPSDIANKAIWNRYVKFSVKILVIKYIFENGSGEYI